MGEYIKNYEKSANQTNNEDKKSGKPGFDYKFLLALVLTIAFSFVIRSFMNSDDSGKEDDTSEDADAVEETVALACVEDIVESRVAADIQPAEEFAVEDKVVVPALVEDVYYDDDEIFYRCEKAPSFPGGRMAMLKYIENNVKYPTDCKEQGIQGFVVVRFVVNKDGSIGDVEVVRAIHPSLDKEALRVVKSMPNWNPGEIQGKTVRARFTTPVRFRLQN